MIQPWHNLTTLHPIGLIAVMLLGVAMMLAPRRYAVAPLLIMACFISPAQRVVMATLDFDLMRLMILFGWARVIIRHDARGFVWKRLDVMVILWAFAGSIAMTLLEGTLGTFVNRLGLIFDTLGAYLLLRVLIRGWEDIEAIARSAAIVSIPVAIVFIVEHTTARNMFSILGGVKEITTIRDGRLRCQGPFPHPILAGCFWAALMPLIGSLWFNSKAYRWLAPIGLAGSFIVVVTTASATPLSAVIFGLGAAALFPLRRYMGCVQLLGVFVLILLNFVMTMPLWHLMARIDIVSGSTGWYRYKILDEFFKHFSDWWLIGCNNYRDWWEYGFGALTNQFIVEGVAGGLTTLLLFIGIIVMGFRAIGRIRKTVERHRPRTYLAWAMGVSLFIHVISFLGVSYNGQIIMLWYLALAMIGSLMPSVRPLGRPIIRIPATKHSRPNATLIRICGYPSPSNG